MFTRPPFTCGFWIESLSPPDTVLRCPWQLTMNVQCPYCRTRTVYESLGKLSTHFKVAHPRSNRTLYWPNCEAAQSLRSCPCCDFLASTIQGLKAHVHRIHPLFRPHLDQDGNLNDQGVVLLAQQAGGPSTVTLPTVPANRPNQCPKHFGQSPLALLSSLCCSTISTRG